MCGKSQTAKHDKETLQSEVKVRLLPFKHSFALPSAYIHSFHQDTHSTPNEATGL